MTSKTSSMKYFLIAFTLMFISSGLNAGTFGSDGKKKDKEKKEELSADGPILPIGAFHRMQFHIKWKSAFMIYHMQGKIFG